jgi:transglutaminase-like putative cysteine protease
MHKPWTLQEGLLLTVTRQGRRSYVRPLLVILLLSLSLTLWLNTQAQASASLTPAPQVAEATTTSTSETSTSAAAETTEETPEPATTAKTEPPASTPPPAPTQPAPAPQPAQAVVAQPPVVQVASVPAPAPAGAVQLQLTMRTTFTNVGTTEVRSGYVDVPLLANIAGTSQETLSERITPAPTEVRVDGFGNRIGRFTLADIPAGGTLVIQQVYRLEYRAAATQEASPKPGPEYLLGETKIEANAPQIQALARELAQETSDPRVLAIKIAQKTAALIKYDAYSPTRNQGALAALQSGTGVCEEYACLFTAIARATGLPARVLHGFARDRDSARAAWNGVAGANVALAPYRHAWAEVYLPGLGWITVDPTYNRADLGSGSGFKAVAPGTFITEGFTSSPVSGRYVGGKLQAERRETLGW